MTLRDASRNSPPPVHIAGILPEGCCPSNVEECHEIIRPHVVMYIRRYAKVIRLGIFEDEKHPMAVIKVWDDDDVLTFQTAQHPPVPYVPKLLP